MRQSRQRVNEIQIASPCAMSWDAMEGDERVRFCGDCKLHVYNLAAMDVEEAATLIDEENAHVCVRLVRRRDGTVLTRDCPVGRRIAVRRKRAAMWASLAVSAGVLGASGPRQRAHHTVQVHRAPEACQPVQEVQMGAPAAVAPQRQAFAAPMGEIRMGRRAPAPVRAPRSKP